MTQMFWGPTRSGLTGFQSLGGGWGGFREFSGHIRVFAGCGFQFWVSMSAS